MLATLNSCGDFDLLSVFGQFSLLLLIAFEYQISADEMMHYCIHPEALTAWQRKKLLAAAHHPSYDLHSLTHQSLA